MGEARELLPKERSSGRQVSEEQSKLQAQRPDKGREAKGMLYIAVTSSAYVIKQHPQWIWLNIGPLCKHGLSSNLKLSVGL